MWIVLFALILNNILITNQVSYNNLKPKHSLLFTRKTHYYTNFNQKLRNVRKNLRKERRNLPKIDIDGWGYDDISEPLHYNYKEIWWTNNYPDPGKETKKTPKTNVKNAFTNPTTKVSNLPTTIVDIRKLNKTKSTKKNLRNVTEDFVNQIQTTKTIVRSEKTSQINQQFTKFVDENKGRYLPVLTKDDNGQFSIMANQTNLLVKKNENDSDVRGSINKNIFISNDLDLNEFDYVVINPKDNADSNKHLAQRQNPKNEPVVIKVVNTDDISQKIKNQAQDTKIILTPDQSKILPNVVKDGIYRIEIPDPVTRKTSFIPQTVSYSYSNPNVPSNYYPPKHILFGGAKGSNNIQSGYSRQGPFSYTENSRYHSRPFYRTKGPSFTQQRPFYNFRNPDYDRPPFYGTKNLEPNEHGPFYMTQNPGFDNQGPFYNPKGLNHNRQPFHSQNGPPFNQNRPLYESQYPDYNRPRPFYSTPRLGQNRQFPSYNSPYPGPNYDTNNLGQHEQGLLHHTKLPEPTSHNVQQPNNNDVKGPSYSTNATADNTQDPTTNANETKRGRQGPQPKIEGDAIADVLIEKLNEGEVPKGYEDIVFGVESPTATTYIEVVERTTTTFEPGKGPNRANRPVYFDRPSTERLSPYVKAVLKDMEELKVGYFSMFLIRFFEIMAKKKPDALLRLMKQAQREATILFEQEHLLVYFGEPFGGSLKSFASHMDTFAVDAAQSAAAMLHYAMVNRREGVTLDINSVIDYIDSLYEDHEGLDLLKVVEDIEVYPDGELDCFQLHRKLSKVLYEPVRRLSGTSKRQILFDSLNKVIENHMKAPEGAIARRHGNNFGKNSKFHFTRFKASKGHENEWKRHKLVANDKSKSNKLNTSKPFKRVPTLKLARRSTVSMDNIKLNRFTSKTIIKHTNNIERTYSKAHKKYRQQNNMSNVHRIEIGMTSKLQMKNIKVTEETKLKSDIIKSSHFLEPLPETTVNKVIFTTKNIRKIIRNNTIAKVISSNDKIDKLKDIIANQVLKAKAVNNVSTTARTITTRTITNKTLFDDKMETNITNKILEKETTTTESSKKSYKLKEQHKSKKEKSHKSKKTLRLRKKEIEHLRQRHPRIYKSYLRHLKRSKSDSKHKKKTHNPHGKKSRYSKNKKRSKISKTIKGIEHYYERLLNHYMLKKAHLKARSNDNEENIKVDPSDDYSDYKQSIEKKITKDTIFNIATTPKFGFITPLNKARFRNNKITNQWFHYPVEQIKPRAINTNLEMRSGINKNFAFPIHRSSQNFKNVQDFAVKINNVPKLNILKEYNSYSDEENALKINLYDAMRHDKLYFIPERRAMNIKKNKNKLRSFSSYSSEEVVLKSNIYKAIGFNQYRERANFSDVVKKKSNKGKMTFNNKE